MTDDEFLHTFLRGWPVDQPFHHYDHLRVAWLVIERHGPEPASEIVGDRLRQMAAAKGLVPLYNETVTRFWIRLLDHVRNATSAGGIDDAIELVPMLLDKNTPLRHWTRTAIFGPVARTTWVEPDLRPIPF